MAKAPRKPAAPALQGADNDPAGNDPAGNDPAGNDPAGGVVQAPAVNPPADAEDPVPPTPTSRVVMHSIRALRDGFRRAGVAWSTQAQEVSADQFTPEEIDALCAEPLLVVEYIVQEV